MKRSVMQEKEQTGLKLITRTGSIQQHNLSVQGGTELTKYMVSFNYFDQKGIIKNSELKRFTGKINLDQILANILSWVLI